MNEDQPLVTVALSQDPPLRMNYPHKTRIVSRPSALQARGGDGYNDHTAHRGQERRRADLCATRAHWTKEYRYMTKKIRRG